MNCAVQTLEAPCSYYEDGIILHVIVGVYEWERVKLRPLIFDVRLESSVPLELNRALLEQRLEAWLAPSRYRLLEAMSEYLCARLLKEWPCDRVLLGIEKPGALGDIARVGIRITRSRM